MSKHKNKGNDKHLAFPKHAPQNLGLKLESCSPENLEFLKTCAEFIEDAPKLFRDFSGKTTTEHSNDLMGSFSQMNVPHMKAALALFHHDQQLAVHSRWAEETCASLSKPELWKQFFNAIKNKQKPELNGAFQLLQSDWKRQESLATVASQTLYTFGNALLPSLKEYVAFAELEIRIKRTSLTVDELVQVSEYLKTLKAWLYQLEGQLCEAMMARLMVASEMNDLTYDDVVSYTVQKLKALGALKADYKIPNSLCGLTPELFNYFQAYLGEHATKHQKRRLKTRLRWLQKHENYQTIIGDKHLIVVPTTLSFLLPQTRFQKFRLRITWGYSALLKKVQSEQHLFAEVRLAEHFHLAIKDENFHRQFAKLRAYHSTLSESFARTQQEKPQGIFRWLRPLQMRACKAFVAYYQKALEQLADKLIQALSKLVEGFEGEAFIDEKLAVTEEIAHRVELIKNELLKLSDNLTLTQKETLEHLYQRYHQLYQTYHKPRVHPFQHYLDEIAKGELKGQGYLTPLYDYIQVLKTNEDEEAKKFQAKCLIALEGITPRYEALLHALSQGQLLKEEQTPYLARALVCLKKLGDEATEIYLWETLYTLYEIYLKKGSEVQSPRDDAWFTQCEGILLTQAQYLNQSKLLENLKALHTLRKQFPEDYSLGCRTALTKFRENLLREKAQNDLIHLEQEVWRTIEVMGFFNDAAIKRFHVLVDEAVTTQTPLQALSLSPADKTLLGLTRTGGYRKDQQPFRKLDLLID